MPKINLARQMDRQLPAELSGFLRSAGRVAAGRRENLYLVGGAVRDLLLGEANYDLDLVVEGDGPALAAALAPGSKLTVHRRFGTAKFKWQQWNVDLATARRESYSRPGALPRVAPGSIGDDLWRRDYSVNAMAIALNPRCFGSFMDLYGGREDLGAGLLRILHERSFIDDATRIWRGLRYEQRLGFKLERKTLRLLKQHTVMLDTISGDRLRHELESILAEECPERVIRRAAQLDVLASLHPKLEGNGWLRQRYGRARRLTRPQAPSATLYLALLAYRLTEQQKEEFISKLRLTKPVARTLRDTAGLHNRLKPLSAARLKPSRIYDLVHGYDITAVTATMLAAGETPAGRRLGAYLDKLRFVKTALSGTDLKAMGVTPGPGFKEIINELRRARLDSQAGSRQDEEALARKWLAAGPPSPPA
jgi:tRNA nucleotidyltransferase (CCA-adding enzyme)